MSELAWGDSPIDLPDEAPGEIKFVETAPGARLGALDPKTGRIYLPSAKRGPPVPPDPLHLLVIDDSPTVLKVIEGTLTRAGYVVATAGAGAEGLALDESELTGESEPAASIRHGR